MLDNPQLRQLAHEPQQRPTFLRERHGHGASAHLGRRCCTAIARLRGQRTREILSAACANLH